MVSLTKCTQQVSSKVIGVNGLLLIKGTGMVHLVIHDNPGKPHVSKLLGTLSTTLCWNGGRNKHTYSLSSVTPTIQSSPNAIRYRVFELVYNTVHQAQTTAYFRVIRDVKSYQDYIFEENMVDSYDK